MTIPSNADLMPCPFCGAGENRIDENGRVWRGTAGYTEPVSIEIRHWCTKIEGQPQVTFSIKGRDLPSAIAAWNTRSDVHLAKVEELQRLAKNVIFSWKRGDITTIGTALLELESGLKIIDAENKGE